MIDPLFQVVVAFAFASLFAGAAFSKIRSFSRFTAIVSGYQLMPAWLVRPVSTCVVAIECSIVALWLVPAMRQIAAWSTAAVLTTYALAIAANILRGRSYIDCGCGFGRKGSQMLSPALIFRNLLLIVMASLAAMPGNPRPLGGSDYLVVAVAVLVLMLLYAASGQLLGNNGAIKTWRRR